MKEKQESKVYLTHNEMIESVKSVVGKTIKNIGLDTSHNTCRISLENGTMLVVQSYSGEEYLLKHGVVPYVVSGEKATAMEKAADWANDLSSPTASENQKESTLHDSEPLGAAPCSPDGVELSERDLFCIDFLTEEGEIKESIQFSRSPIQDTSHLYLLLKKVLSSFGIVGLTPRIRPGKFGGIQQGKFTVLLGSGKHLEFENINL